MSTNQSDYMLDKKPIVLDEGEVHGGEPWLASEVVEVEAEGVGGELGVDAGRQPPDRLGAVALGASLPTSWLLTLSTI